MDAFTLLLIVRRLVPQISATSCSAARCHNGRALRSTEAFVRPRPIAEVRMVGCDGLPNERVSQRFDAEGCDGINVRQALEMPCLLDLVEELVSELDNSALKPTAGLAGVTT